MSKSFKFEQKINPVTNNTCINISSIPVELFGNGCLEVYFPLEWYKEAQVFILTNGECTEEDQLFNNDT